MKFNEANSLKVLRCGLAPLALECVVIGVHALFFPRYFYSSFFLGRGWVQMLPPYNEHLTIDLGALYLGLAVILIWATIDMSRQLVAAALAGFSVATIPHMIFHALHTDAAPELFDKVAQVGALAFSLAVCLVLLLINHRRVPGKWTVDARTDGR